MPKSIGNSIERSFYENFGKELSKQRNIRNISRADLAKKLGVTTQSLGLYERGMARMSAYVFIEICRNLQIDPHRLIFSVFNEPQLTLDFFGTEEPLKEQKNYDDHAHTASISVAQEIR